MFYKLINETTIQRAPRPLVINDEHVFTNSEAIHNEQGYFRLLTSDYPQDDNFYFPKYKLIGTLIVQEWVVGEIIL
jgi:hypothetical protein